MNACEHGHTYQMGAWHEGDLLVCSRCGTERVYHRRERLPFYIEQADLTWLRDYPLSTVPDPELCEECEGDRRDRAGRDPLGRCTNCGGTGRAEVARRWPYHDFNKRLDEPLSGVYDPRTGTLIPDWP